MPAFLASTFLTSLLPQIAASEARSRAVELARSTGEVIGAAMACDVPDERLIAIGKEVIGRVREAARSPREVGQARKAHEAAVKRASDPVPTNCPEAIRLFEELERDVTAEKV